MQRKALLVSANPCIGLKGPWIRTNGDNGWVVEGPSEVVGSIILHVEELSGRLHFLRMDSSTTQLPNGAKRVKAEVIDSVVISKLIVLELREANANSRRDESLSTSGTR